MAAKDHKCAAPQCEVLVPWHILMCATHWRMVPGPLKIAVLRTWNNGGSSQAYLAARDAAIRAVGVRTECKNFSHRRAGGK